MEFPIDIVCQGEVVDIARKFQLMDARKLIRYPRKESNAVLELSAGWAENGGEDWGENKRLRTKMKTPLLALAATPLMR